MVSKPTVNPRYISPDGGWYDPGFDYVGLKAWIAEQIPERDDMGYIFERSKMYEEFFTEQITWREAQSRGLVGAVTVRTESRELTDEEREYICMKLAQANDPIAQGILSKLRDDTCET